MRPLFTLDDRLKACADFVQKGARLVDIGTDHAYLPIWLARAGKIKHAIAADVKLAPLESARKNISKYSVKDTVDVCLSDGLIMIDPNEVDDIVIAGMGGQTIVQILDRCQWVEDPCLRFILQPMTADNVLREFLFKKKFQIVKEVAVKSGGHVYAVMLAQFVGDEFAWSLADTYIGKLDASPCACEYLQRQIRHLQNKKNDPSLDKDELEHTIGEIASYIENVYSTSDNDNISLS